jgi:hypothetical protein
METRTVILAIALVFIGLLAYLTVRVLIVHGPDVLTALSLLVLALLGFGVVGALRNPPPE